MEGKKWPPYWPCKACGKAWKDHLKYGEITPPSVVPNASEWCYNDATNISYYKPMDNLTYIELKDKERMSK